MSSGLFLPSVARPPHRRRRRVLVGAIVVASIVSLLGGAVGVVALAERGKAPAGTTIDGVDVGRMSKADARRAVAAAAGVRIARPIRVIGPGGALLTSGTELGARAFVDDAVAKAIDAGAVERVLGRVGIGASKELELEYRLGPVRAARVANRIDDRFGERPRDAAVTVAGAAIAVEPAAPGTSVDRGELRRALQRLPREVGIHLDEAAPVVSTDEAYEAVAGIEKLLDGGRIVRFRGVDARLSPSRLRSLLSTEPRDGRLAVVLDPAGLAEALRQRLGRFEQPTRDAAFEIRGTRVHVVPSGAGVAIDGARTGASLTNNLTATTHLARFTVSRPELTTAEAEGLGIHELISEFTTYHPCCAPRVSNIHRGAEIMDGTIVRPDERFSLNEVLGKRTVERGFVSAPQIFNGRLEDAIGGGVSQIATTTYNAAFFAGVRIGTHQPHQFYISRYPMGREATVSWGGPELIWKNDWPAAILVKVATTDTSITVRLYSSTLGRRVTTETGEPTDYVQPKTITVENGSLPPGTTSIVQSAGPPGFTIRYTRKVFRDGKLRRNEHYVWRYDAEDAIIEVGPPEKAKPKPKRNPGPGAAATTPKP